MKKIFSTVVFLFLNNAFAEGGAGGAGAPGAPNPMASLIPFALIFGIFYFLMIRPQKKKMQEESAMLNTLTKGDEVITKSGLLGTIAGLNEKVVTLEVSEGVKLKVLRGHIAGLAKKLLQETNASEKKE